MKKIIGIMLGAAILISGCAQQAPADLLQIPEHGKEDEALVTAVRQMLPPESKLALPYQEKGINAIRKADLNGDRIEEAVVTYKDEYEVRQVLLMRQKEGQWRKWFELNGSYYELYWLEIVSLNDDNIPELLIGYQSYESETLLVDVFMMSDPNLQKPGAAPPEPVATLPYSLADTGDITGDGKKELFIVEHNERNFTAAANLYRIQKNQLQKIASTEIDGNVNAYYASEIGKVAKNKSGFRLEASVGAHSSISYMFVLEEEGRLKQIYPKEGEPYLNAKGTINSDLNGDGIMEIVDLMAAPGQDPNTPYVATLFLNKHLQWDGRDRFEMIGLQYTNYQYGYSLLIPEKWEDRFTISNPKSQETEVIVFEFFDEQSGHRAELFTLHAVDYDSWSETEHAWQKKGDSYTVIQTAAGFVYAAVFHSGPNHWNKDDKEMLQNMQLSEEELKKHFIIIDPEE